MNKVNNGRVDIKSPNTTDLFKLYDKIPANQCVTFRNATEGLWNDTLLSTTFFSKENIQILQNGIRAGVYFKSNSQYTIGSQDCDSLKIIMRSIFLQNAINLPNDIASQINELNKLVLNYCIQQVYSEAQSYLKYLDDASTLVVPIAHPIKADSKDRTLEFSKWFS
jgi:hypothetical protein